MTTPPRCANHGNIVCSHCVEVTDAAKRMADQVNGRIRFCDWEQLRRCYMAFRLEDGRTDGVLYDSKRDAALFTDERRHCYFWFGNAMAGVTAKDMQIFLNVCRHAADQGLPLADPDERRGGDSLIISTAGYDHMKDRRW